MPDAIITSTASTFGTISGTFAADQSTITGTVTGGITGTISGSVGIPGPVGPAGPGSTWGGIAGVLSNQVDLWSELGSKYPASNPSGFITASALSPYLTTATANATFQTLAGMSSYLTTSAAAAGYYPLTGNPSGFLTAASLSGYATESWVTGQGYLTSAALTPYLLSSTAASTYYLQTNPAGYQTASQVSTALSPYLLSATASATYQTLSGMSDYLSKAGNLSGLASTSTARTNLGLGSLAVINDAPSDGSQYARKNGAWDVVTATSSYITSVSSPLSVTSGNLTIDLSPYAPLSSPVFTGDARAVTPTFGDNDTSIATTAFVQSALAGGTAVARNLEVEVRNQSGSTIPAGSIVYISGATGNKPLITLAQANNDTNSAQTIGFVKTSIANNGTGFVIIRGELENIDTSALTEGVQLYLSPTTAGAWTTTKPSAPQHLVYVGICVRSHPTLGTILVAVQNGYELDELHDVAIASKTNNDLLAYESSTDLWKNKSFGTLGLLTSADLTGYATESWVTAGFYPLTGNPSSFLVAADIAGKANTASAALTGNVTITTNSTSPALVITQDGTGDIVQFKDVTSDTTYSFIDASGKVGTIASTTANAGFNIAHGAAPTTPVNGDIWTTTSGLFMRQNGTTKQYVDFDGTQTINGSKTFSNANNTFGNSTAAGTTNIASGATISGATKAVNLGTSGVAGSTTNITIGSTTGTSTTTLQGITNGVTQSAGDSSLKLATTAFVTTADNLKANLASPTFTGVPAAPTATPGTNTTQLATTAFVTAAVPAFASLTEARQFSNTTKVLSPSLALWSMFSADIIYLQRSNFTVTNVGSVQYVNLGSIATETRLASAAASSSRARTFGAGQVDQSQSATVRTNISGFLNFSKPTYLAGRSATYDITDPVLTMAFYYGKAEADGVGDLTRRGMGWKVTGGTGSRFLTLQVHNGTTLTSVTSSFAVTGSVAFDWDIISDGAGNVTLYVNGASVATSSAGPTGLVNLTPVLWQEEYSTSAAPAISFHTSYNSRGRMAVINY